VYPSKYHPEAKVRFILFFFIIVPLSEMILLFAVSDRIGGLVTLSLVVATAVIGVQILKRQGLSTLLRANQRLAAGELPAQEIVEGMMLAGAGALLLTPGFITDTIGFAFLTGPIRRPLARKIIRSGIVNTLGSSNGGRFSFRSATDSANSFDNTGGNVYEGEFVDEEVNSSRTLNDDNNSSEKHH